jgi:hypothetical protein
MIQHFEGKSYPIGSSIWTAHHLNNDIRGNVNDICGAGLRPERINGAASVVPTMHAAALVQAVGIEACADRALMPTLESHG